MSGTSELEHLALKLEAESNHLASQADEQAEIFTKMVQLSREISSQLPGGDSQKASEKLIEAINSAVQAQAALISSMRGKAEGLARSLVLVTELLNNKEKEEKVFRRKGK